MNKLYILILSTLVLASCGPKVSKNCQLEKILSENGKEIVFSYTDGRLSGMTIKIKGREQEVTYSYTEDGKISELSTDRGSIKYIYNDKGVLTKTESKILHSSSFDYANGQITGQKMGAKYFEYAYKDGNPNKVLIKDSNGDLLEQVDITYDKNPNAMSDIGPMGNFHELMYGYPVGNAKNNIVSVTTTYKKDTKWKINGELKKAGDVVEAEYAHEYDSHGNVVSTKNKGTEQAATYYYNCD